MTTSYCPGPGQQMISNGRSQTMVPCRVCHAYHPKAPAVPSPAATKQAQIDRIGQALTDNPGTVAGVTPEGAVKLFLEPTPPRVPTAEELAAPKQRAAR